MKTIRIIKTIGRLDESEHGIPIDQRDSLTFGNICILGPLLLPIVLASGLGLTFTTRENSSYSSSSSFFFFESGEKKEAPLYQREPFDPNQTHLFISYRGHRREKTSNARDSCERHVSRKNISPPRTEIFIMPRGCPSDTMNTNSLPTLPPPPARKRNTIHHHHRRRRQRNKPLPPSSSLFFLLSFIFFPFPSLFTPLAHVHVHVPFVPVFPGSGAHAGRTEEEREGRGPIMPHNDHPPV